MRALEPLGHQDSILSNLEELISVDPMRRGFYCDFRSKYLMENEVDKLAVREEISQTIDCVSAQPVNLSSKGLTSIHYAVYLTGWIGTANPVEMLNSYVIKTTCCYCCCRYNFKQRFC